MIQLLAPEGLYAEITEVYKNSGERPASELMAMLNSPGRIQTRGFPVTQDHLLAVIISNWRIDDDTRFFIYDTDGCEIASRDIYKDPHDAAADAGLQSNDCIVKRFQL